MRAALSVMIVSLITWDFIVDQATQSHMFHIPMMVCAQQLGLGILRTVPDMLQCHLLSTSIASIDGVCRACTKRDSDINLFAAYHFWHALMHMVHTLLHTMLH
jgi:hypothetical protein